MKQQRDLRQGSLVLLWPISQPQNTLLVLHLLQQNVERGDLSFLHPRQTSLIDSNSLEQGYFPQSPVLDLGIAKCEKRPLVFPAPGADITNRSWFS